MIIHRSGRVKDKAIVGEAVSWQNPRLFLIRMGYK